MTSRLCTVPACPHADDDEWQHVSRRVTPPTAHVWARREG
jgi:hypothetical protein